MRAEQIVIMTVAALVLIGGAAAVGTAAPADAANETAVNETEDVPTDQDNIENPGENSSENQSDSADGVGPSDGLPSQAADHVSEIHEQIDAFLNDGIDQLGHALEQLLGNGNDG